MQTLSQRNGRHVPSAQAGGALQNPAYRPADALKMRGSAPTRRTPRQLEAWLRDGTSGPLPALTAPFALRAPYLGINAGAWTGLSVRGIVLNRSSRCIRNTVVLAAAITIAGCADSRMAANNNASSGAPASGEAPYHTAYGISSDGPTTDLYTEFFGSSRGDNTTVSPASQQAQPVTAAAPPQQVQPATASATNRPVPRTTASAANRRVQPAPAPLATAQVTTTQVAPQPVAAPQPPPEPNTPTAYGISSNGPTTDLYTELFGPRRRDGQ